LQEYTLSDDPNLERRLFGYKPATNFALLREQSPLTYAAAARTPLLVVIGLRDARAPYSSSIEFCKALIENGATERLLADPRAGHFPHDPRGVRSWYAATYAWLAQYGAPGDSERRPPEMTAQQAPGRQLAPPLPMTAYPRRARRIPRLRRPRDQTIVLV